MSFPVWGQASDSCGSAPSISGSGSYPYNTTTATTDSPSASCGWDENGESGSGLPPIPTVDVWYRYTAGINGIATLSATNIDPPTGGNPIQLSVHQGSCGGAEVGCSADAVVAWIGAAPVTVSISAGQVYYIRIGSYADWGSSGSGNLVISESNPPPPANDSCASPTAINGSQTVNVTTAFASNDRPNASCGGVCAPAADVWFNYTASATGMARFSVIDAVAPYPQEVSLSAWSGCGGSELACVANGMFLFGGGDYMWLPVVNGQSYRVRVATLRGPADCTNTLSSFQTLNGKLRVEQFPTPANDTCAGATLLNGPGDYSTQASGPSGTYSALAAAKADGPFPTCGTGSSATQRDLWYRYQAASTGTVLVDLIAPSFNQHPTYATTIAVFTGCAGSQIACSSHAGSSDQEQNKFWACFAATAGQQYYVRISQPETGTRTDMTNFRFREYPAPSTRENCATAQEITAPASGTNSYPWDDVGACGNNASYTDSCSGGLTVAGSVWFRFTPPSTGLAIFKNESQISFQFGALVMEALTSCGATSSIACNRHLGDSPSGNYLAVPVTAGNPIYIRISRLTNIVYPISCVLKVSMGTAPINDECAGAIEVSLGETSYDIRNATLTVSPSAPTCPVTPLTRDLWYKWSPPVNATAILDLCRPLTHPATTASHITVYKDSCNGPQIACDPRVHQATEDSARYYPQLGLHVSDCYDSLRLQSLVEFTALAGTTYYIRIADRSEALELRQNRHFNIEMLPTSIQEAVDLLPSATVMSGPANEELFSISGVLASGLKADVYKIQICDAENFAATTVNGTTLGLDTALFLFDSSGRGVSYSDDTFTGLQSTLTGQFVPGNGVYYLAVAGGGRGRMALAGGQRMWQAEPFTVERAPDGPGFNGSLTGWAGTGAPLNGIFNSPYRIDLFGACLVSACPADFNGDSTRDVSDLFAYINAWLAKTANADFNNSGNVDVADLFAYINAWLAGC